MTDLTELLKRPDIWQASRATGQRADSLPTGQAALDAALHHGGWPRAALTELLGDQTGIGELRLLMPALAHCSHDRRCLLLAPPCLPYAPALDCAGIATRHLLIVQPQNRADLLWCAEQALRSPACSCLLVWLQRHELHYRDLRRLQLAARSGDKLSFVFRPTRAARDTSPAPLRLQLDATPRHLLVRILKQRGGHAGQVLKLPHGEELLRPRLHASMLPALTSTVARRGTLLVHRHGPVATAVREMTAENRVG